MSLSAQASLKTRRTLATHAVDFVRGAFPRSCSLYVYPHEGCCSIMVPLRNSAILVRLLSSSVLSQPFNHPSMVLNLRLAYCQSGHCPSGQLCADRCHTGANSGCGDDSDRFLGGLHKYKFIKDEEKLKPTLRAQCGPSTRCEVRKWRAGHDSPL